MLNKEPTVIIGGVAELIKAVIPLLLIFGLINWTDPQIGAVILFVGVAVGVAEKWFQRSQVIPTEKANSQILTATRMPEGTSVEAVIAKNEKEANP